MESQHYLARTQRQRDQKRAERHQYVRETLFVSYTSHNEDNTAYGILAHYAFNTASAPEKTAPRLPQDDLWLTKDDTSAKAFKKVSGHIGQKEKAEQNAARPLMRSKTSVRRY